MPPTHTITHPHLIAVDWGTSALRAALIPHGQIAAVRHSDQGILQIPPGGFANALALLCGDWMAHPQALTLICGMAGSAQGWQLAPYMACPSPLQNLTQHLVWVQDRKVAMVYQQFINYPAMTVYENIASIRWPAGNCLPSPRGGFVVLMCFQCSAGKS